LEIKHAQTSYSFPVAIAIPYLAMCDSLIVRGSRTTDGTTLFAKNSDRRGREPQPFVQFPAAFHPRGSSLRCTHIEIDQVAETYRVMGHSPEWCWGFEHGVNEHGVAIGNHATWSREPLEQEPGLIGMDLVRLGLERGRDAREALEIIAALLEVHGQGGPSFAIEGDDGYQNSFFIADGRSAWVLETTARAWAARSVEGANLTNELTLGAGWQIGSRDLERAARQQGFWKSKDRLDFKAAYAIESWPAFLAERRQGAATQRLEGPALSLADLKEWLCDHGNVGDPPSASRDFNDPDRYSVCMHADPMSMTTASIVAHLPEEMDRQPWPVWISFATPCTGLFVPVYLDGVIPASFASAGEPESGSGSGVASVWCAMRDLQERATVDFERTLPILRAGWSEVEREIEAERVRVEQEAADLYAAGKTEAGAAALTDFMATTAERMLETSQRLAAAI
jgi:secernin